MFSSGADVIHPAPGSEGRPSFAALVGNVDSDTAKYVAGEISMDFIKPIPKLVLDSRVQASKQEMIEDLEVMSKVYIFAK